MKNQSQSQRILIPRPNRIRRLGSQGFGWLDARIHRRGWLELLSPETLSIYTFLCLAANHDGVSWYRRDRLGHILGLSESNLHQSLERLYLLDLVAHKPFHRHASDGFHQVLELPNTDPPAPEDLLFTPDPE